MCLQLNVESVWETCPHSVRRDTQVKCVLARASVRLRSGALERETAQPMKSGKRNTHTHPKYPSPYHPSLTTRVRTTITNDACSQIVSHAVRYPSTHRVH